MEHTKEKRNGKNELGSLSGEAKKETIPSVALIEEAMLRLHNDGKEHSMKELLQLLKEDFKLTNSDMERKNKSGTRSSFYVKATWAKSVLKKQEYIEPVINRKGVSIITKNGVAYLKGIKDEAMEFRIEEEKAEKNAAMMAKDKTTKQLLEMINNEKNKQPKKRSLNTTVWERDHDVSIFVKQMADGKCQLCKKEAPFNHNGKPYLETHHIDLLSEKGADTPENTVALCPNCHRKMHIKKLKEDKDKLKRIAKEIAKKQAE